jgi:hypothetical protein
MPEKIKLHYMFTEKNFQDDVYLFWMSSSCGTTLAIRARHEDDAPNQGAYPVHSSCTWICCPMPPKPEVSIEPKPSTLGVPKAHGQIGN